MVYRSVICRIWQHLPKPASVVPHVWLPHALVSFHMQSLCVKPPDMMARLVPYSVLRSTNASLYCPFLNVVIYQGCAGPQSTGMYRITSVSPDEGGSRRIPTCIFTRNVLLATSDIDLMVSAEVASRRPTRHRSSRPIEGQP